MTEFAGNIKIRTERVVLNQPSRKLVLDDKGRMRLRMPDGSTVVGTPIELFGPSRDLKVVHSLDLDTLLTDAIEKELMEEMGL